MPRVVPILLLLLLSHSAASASTWVVTPDGTGDFPTIRDAVAAAADGDVIELIDGIYYGPDNRDIDYLGKAITIRSQAQDPTNCIINCQFVGRGFLFQTGEDSTSVLTGITVAYGGSEQGSVYCSGSSPRIADCIFMGNDAGAMFCDNASGVVENCIFADNHSSVGGAIESRSSPLLIRDCDFYGNTASFGGAIYVPGGSQSPTVIRCAFEDNSATQGGAIDTRLPIQVVECVFWGNQASFRGGAIYSSSNPSVSQSTFFANGAADSGGALYVGGPSLIENTIIAFSNPGNATAGALEFICSDIFGNEAGPGSAESYIGSNGNIAEDPLFCDPENGDFHLEADSPCAPFTPPNQPCDLIGAWNVGCGPECDIVATYPDSGATVCSGDPLIITWDASGICSGDARLELLQGGTTCTTITESTTNDGSYVWFAEQCGGLEAGYSIRITDLGTLATDDTDGFFAIPSPCTLTMTNPEGASSYFVGQDVEISWDRLPCCGDLAEIELLQNGTPCQTVATATPNDGTFTWTAAQCGTAEANYSIRTTDLETGASTTSDPFMITLGCSITVSNPFEAQDLIVGSTTQISWDRSDSCGVWAKVELFRDDQICLAIADSTENDGEYEWTVDRCGTEWDQYRVRVTDLDSELYDDSQSFTIHEAFQLLSITDVGNDQGRRVRVRWQRAPHDRAATDTMITAYSIWRRIDEFSRPSLGNRALRQPGPPGSWDFVTELPASGQETYSTICETLCDSTASDGICWSTFFVRAATPEPLIYFDTPPDSGYSIDNLAPGVPGDFRWDDTIPFLLIWEEAEEDDFDYFTVFGSDHFELDGTAVLLAYTTETSLNVFGETYRYFFVTATDFAGNRGQPAELPRATEVPETTPAPLSFGLHPPRPNPAQETVLFRIDVPIASEVQVTIHDASGRRIQTVVDEFMTAGSHTISWSASHFAAFATGVYFVRLQAREHLETRQLVITR